MTPATVDPNGWEHVNSCYSTRGMSSQWYMLYTRSNCEGLVYDQLVKKGFSLFLPRIAQNPGCGDMRHLATAPLFPGYVFVNHAMDKASYVELRKARGVVSILGERWDCLATVPNNEIEAIQSALRVSVPIWPYARLREGTRVRFVHGPLTGVEGV